jgi:hypothetical protein
MMFGDILSIVGCFAFGGYLGFVFSLLLQIRKDVNSLKKMFQEGIRP